MSADPGQTISHYRIIEKIGEGGMGVVFLAHDTQLDRKVALKFLPETMQKDPNARARFVNEARAAAALDHPFICKIYEAGEAAGQSFIAMEYVAGETLSRRLKRETVLLPEALRIAAAIADALEEAHRNGIVHRDLKPSNIILTAQGHVKVMDFGLAKRLGPGESAEEEDLTHTASLTKEGTTLGTWAYMSPEQVLGHEVDTRSDIFSFGVLLYRIVAGKLPFEKKLPMDTADAILHETPPPLARYAERLPELLEHTVKKALAKDAAQRYQSVHEIRTNLDELLREAGEPSTSVGLVPARRRGFSPVLVLGLAAVVIAAALGMAWLFGVFEPGAEEATAPSPEQEPPRIAVLPFANLSRVEEDEVFSDGLTESLITMLAKLRDLQVISRTSVMHLKGKDLPLPEIARLLDVDYVLEGSLLKSGDQCRVTAQLIRVADDSHIWADDYRLPWSDIFTIQNEVSRKVAQNVEVALRPADLDLLDERATESIEAYNAYLQGKHFLNQYNNLRKQEHFDEAERSLLAALDLDPGFIEARAELGFLYYLPWENGRVNEEWLDKGEAVSREALELDDLNCLATFTIAGIAGERGDMDTAMTLTTRNIEHCPNDARAHNGLALEYWRHGFYEASLHELDLAMRLDPLYTYPYTNSSILLWLLGRYDEAVARAAEAKRIEPGMTDTYSLMAVANIRKGDLDEAERILQRAIESDPSLPRGSIEFAEAWIAVIRGDPGKARRLLEERRQEEGFKDWLLCALAGETGLAVDLIEQARARRSYRELTADPFLRPLGIEPRFREILQREYQRWQRDLELWGATLPSPPPQLPTPEEYLREL